MIIEDAQRTRTGRLLLAGLVAGIVLNIGEAALHGGMLAEATRTAYKALNRTASPDPMHLTLLIALTFAQATLMAWLCVILRPRFGSRFQTAARVGLAVWLLSSVYAAVYLSAGFPGILPRNLVWAPVAWQLFEYPLVALAGAATYGE